MTAADPRGWYSREYLPHFDGGAITQYVTFTLWDAIPRVVLRKWQDELEILEKMEQEIKRKRRIEAYLDRGEGQAWLKDPLLAELVENALLFFHMERYVLHAWIIMSNHVHVMFTPREEHSLGSILHSWRSFTANKANKYLKKNEEFWFPESYDRYIRDGEHYKRTKRYIEYNSVKAHLCQLPEEWRWSSAYWRLYRPEFQFGEAK